MAYTNAVALVTPNVTTPAFQDLVRAALHNKCIKVGMGGWTDATQKANYLGMMNQFINNPNPFTTAFSWALATYCGLTATATDAQIDAAIDQIWPAVSGYIAATS